MFFGRTFPCHHFMVCCKPVFHKIFLCALLWRCTWPLPASGLESSESSCCVWLSVNGCFGLSVTTTVSSPSINTSASVSCPIIKSISKSVSSLLLNWKDKIQCLSSNFVIVHFRNWQQESWPCHKTRLLTHSHKLPTNSFVSSFFLYSSK